MTQRRLTPGEPEPAAGSGQDQGDPRPYLREGDRRSGDIEAHREAVLAALGPDKDVTINEAPSAPADRWTFTARRG